MRSTWEKRKREREKERDERNNKETFLFFWFIRILRIRQMLLFLMFGSIITSFVTENWWGQMKGKQKRQKERKKERKKERNIKVTFHFSVFCPSAYCTLPPMFSSTVTSSATRHWLWSTRSSEVSSKKKKREKNKVRNNKILFICLYESSALGQCALVFMLGPPSILSLQCIGS